MGYLAPVQIENALSAIGQKGAKIVAGGTDFFPALIAGKLPEHIVDVTRIKEIKGISKTTEGWRIGAATTWSDILSHPFPSQFDCLKQAAKTVGSVQIQNAATIGGNICNASPAADGVPPLLALNAKIEIQSFNQDVRIEPIGEFITGIRQTKLKSGDMLTAIHIPNLPEPSGSSFGKLGSRKYLVISIVMVAVVASVQGGRVQDIRIAVGACSPVATRLKALESDLTGLKLNEITNFEINHKHISPLSPICDIRGTSEFRMLSVKELCLRSITTAVSHG